MAKQLPVILSSTAFFAACAIGIFNTVKIRRGMPSSLPNVEIGSRVLLYSAIQPSALAFDSQA